MKYIPQIIELADGTKCVALEDFRRECEEAKEAIRALAEHGESEIQRITKERDEAREDLKFQRGFYKVQVQYLEMAKREYAEARAITKEAITGLYNLGDYDLANKLSGKLEGPK